MAFLLKRSDAYAELEKEDPEEARHRRAQFLIHKILERADKRRKPSRFRIRLRKLKVKIGRRLKRLRKRMMSSISKARLGVYREVARQLRTLKQLIGSKDMPHPTVPLKKFSSI